MSGNDLAASITLYKKMTVAQLTLYRDALIGDYNDAPHIKLRADFIMPRVHAINSILQEKALAK